MSLLSLLSLLTIGCVADDLSEDPAQNGKADELDSDEVVTLDIRMFWTVGEGEETAELESDDDGEFNSVDQATLGPIGECGKPAIERDADAVCRFDGPSEHWSTRLTLSITGGVPTVHFSATAGSANGAPQLNLAATAFGPWTFSLEPDDASNAVGDISVVIQPPLRTDDD